MMPSENRPYRSLPGKKNGLYRRVRLWMGKDHLLSVDSNIYQERYQRYYYKDIQGIIIRKTARGKIFSGVVGALAALCFVQLLMVWVGSDPVWLWWLWGMASGVLMLFLLVNTALGPTCACHIQTPISTNELPSLHRLRTARKVRDRIRTLVEQEQGRLSREQVRQSLPPALAATGRLQKPTGRPTGTGAAAAPGGSDYSGWAHWTLVGFSLVMAGFLTLYLFINGPAMAAAGLLVGSLLLIVNIVALARQAGGAVPGEVRAVSWTVMVFVFIASIVGYIAMMMTMFRDGQVEPMFSQWTLFLSMSQIRPMEVPFLAAVFIVSAIGLGVAAIFGAIALIAWQRRSASAASLSAAPAPQTTPAGRP